MERLISSLIQSKQLLCLYGFSFAIELVEVQFVVGRLQELYQEYICPHAQEDAQLLSTALQLTYFLLTMETVLRREGMSGFQASALFFQMNSACVEAIDRYLLIDTTNNLPHE